jgi:translation initiation factor 1
MSIDPNFTLPQNTNVFEEIAKSDQRITVTTEARRYGKKTTIVSGFDKNVDLKEIGRKLKEFLACGGTIKDRNIELQGDHQKQVKIVLIKLGFDKESIYD